jgi:hypothetical protein
MNEMGADEGDFWMQSIIVITKWRQYGLGAAFPRPTLRALRLSKHHQHRGFSDDKHSMLIVQELEATRALKQSVRSAFHEFQFLNSFPMNVVGFVL